MDAQQAQDQQTKDFMSSFFPQDTPIDSLQNTADHFQFSQSQNPSNVNMELIGTIGNLINEQVSSYNPGLLLEQQYKLTQLQQLQQLQNQIFQQQIALIAGSQPSPLPIEPEPLEQRASPYHGLPTPGPSTELRAQSSVEYVSPMILNYNDTYSQSQYSAPRGSASAPAYIAFSSAAQDVDFDISPLTSPWLGAHQQPTRAHPRTAARPSAKRAASSSGDETGERPSRKKQSPAIRATVLITKKSSRSKSANSTPMLHSTRARKGSVSVPGDTPSPVDLSMPPPAPPPDKTLVHSSPGLDPQLTPVTPASIMNLGRLGITSSLAGSKPLKKTSSAGAAAGASQGQKAILPGATPSTSMIRPAHPPVQVRKTSHKAAEQKRRDSLKTTFDDLRGLLPPIPLPSDATDEPVLPGALPPRGPPKAGGEGPNKGVSKLQLLMCGNDFIRQLLGRVERRDEEIARLRREVAHLRGVVHGELALGSLEEEADLERNLDAVEAYGTAFGGGGSIVDDEGDEEED
ncbi:hypothetical protein B0H10DRAFT_1992097 [Mycena sp. CBHHK59/15]|nr:hypothetical protein B0H10DRAFT_1992097 [Mycena sp. CBHHK59/15]